MVYPLKLSQLEKTFTSNHEVLEAEHKDNLNLNLIKPLGLSSAPWPPLFSEVLLIERDDVSESDINTASHPLRINYKIQGYDKPRHLYLFILLLFSPKNHQPKSFYLLFQA